MYLKYLSYSTVPWGKDEPFIKGSSFAQATVVVAFEITMKVPKYTHL